MKRKNIRLKTDKINVNHAIVNKMIIELSKDDNLNKLFVNNIEKLINKKAKEFYNVDFKEIHIVSIYLFLISNALTTNIIIEVSTDLPFNAEEFIKENLHVVDFINIYNETTKNYVKPEKTPKEDTKPQEKPTKPEKNTTVEEPIQEEKNTITHNESDKNNSTSEKLIEITIDKSWEYYGGLPTWLKTYIGRDYIKISYTDWNNIHVEKIKDVNLKHNSEEVIEAVKEILKEKKK